MRESNEKLERVFEQYREMYEFDFNQEFYIKELIKLKLQYQDTPDEHIKAKSDLMRMMLDLEQRLALKKKNQILKTFDYDLLIAVSSINDIEEIFSKGLFPDGSNVIKYNSTSKNRIRIELLTGLKIEVIQIPKDINGNYKPDQYRGLKCNSYLNLTNDSIVENWLKCSRELTT